VDDAVSGGPFGGNPRTEVEGLSKASGEKLLTYLLWLPLDQETHADRSGGVIQPRRQEAVLPIKDNGYVPGGTRPALGEYAPIKEPGVSFADRALRSGLNPKRDPGGR
jgi:hypothetical protein